jgi:hypothetical protein
MLKHPNERRVDKIGCKNCFSPKSKIEKVIVLYIASIATSLRKVVGKKNLNLKSVTHSTYQKISKTKKSNKFFRFLFLRKFD